MSIQEARDGSFGLVAHGLSGHVGIPTFRIMADSVRALCEPLSPVIIGDCFVVSNIVSITKPNQARPRGPIVNTYMYILLVFQNVGLETPSEGV